MPNTEQDELVEAVARRLSYDKYLYHADGEPLTHKERNEWANQEWRENIDKAKSAVEAARPIIERALLKKMLEWAGAPPRLHSWMVEGINAFAKENGIDLGDPNSE